MCDWLPFGSCSSWQAHARCRQQAELDLCGKGVHRRQQRRRFADGPQQGMQLALQRCRAAAVGALAEAVLQQEPAHQQLKPAWQGTCRVPHSSAGSSGAFAAAVTASTPAACLMVRASWPARSVRRRTAQASATGECLWPWSYSSSSVIALNSSYASGKAVSASGARSRKHSARHVGLSGSKQAGSRSSSDQAHSAQRLCCLVCACAGAPRTPADAGRTAGEGRAGRSGPA